MEFHDHGMSDPPPELSGWRFPLASAGVFLVPVLCAIVGAVLLGDNPSTQLLGGIAGLALGMSVAALVGRLLRRRKR